MAAISDSTVLHKAYEKKKKRKEEEDKLQQKFEAQGLQNCRSRNADLNFGTIRRYKSTKREHKEKKTKENCVYLYTS